MRSVIFGAIILLLGCVLIARAGMGAELAGCKKLSEKKASCHIVTCGWCQ